MDSYYYKTEPGLIDKARKENTLHDYVSYVNKYPEGKYIKEACDSVYSKLSEWREVNFITMEKYLYDYIKKIKNNELKIRLYELAYKQAVEEKSIDNWKAFIKSIPIQYQKDAYDQMYALEKEIWENEENAWFYITSKDKLEGYYKFMNKFPDGEYYTLARDKYIDLKVNYDINKVNYHETLPKSNKMPKDEYNYYSTMIINNSTDYEIEIFFKGRYNDILILNPRCGNSIELPNGSYCVSANYKSPDSTICIRWEELTGGRFWVTY